MSELFSAASQRKLKSIEQDKREKEYAFMDNSYQTSVLWTTSAGLRMNRKETQSVKNAYNGEGLRSKGLAIAKTPSYLRRSMNVENDLDDELNRRSEAA